MTEHPRPPVAPRPEPRGWLERRVVAGLERERRREETRDAPERRAWLVVLAVGAATLALALTVPAAAGPPTWWALATGSAGGAGVLYAKSFFGRDTRRLLNQDGERVRVRWRRLYPASRAVLSLSLVGLSTAPATEPGAHPAWWLLPAALAGLAAPSWIGAALTPAEVSMDPAGLRVRSWFSDGSIAWDDVAHTRRGTLERGPGGIVVVPYLDATSLVWREHRWAGWVTGHTDHRRLLVHDVAVDEPWRLRRMVEALAAASPAERRRYLSFTAVRYLLRETDELPCPPLRPPAHDHEAVRRWVVEETARLSRPVPPW